MPQNPSLCQEYEVSVGKHLVENGDFIPARTDNRELELQDRNARTTASNLMKLKIFRTLDNQCPRRDKYIVLALVTTPKHRLFCHIYNFGIPSHENVG